MQACLLGQVLVQGGHLEHLLGVEVRVSAGTAGRAHEGHTERGSSAERQAATATKMQAKFSGNGPLPRMDRSPPLTPPRSAPRCP